MREINSCPSYWMSAVLKIMVNPLQIVAIEQLSSGLLVDDTVIVTAFQSLYYPLVWYGWLID